MSFLRRGSTFSSHSTDSSTSSTCSVEPPPPYSDPPPLRLLLSTPAPRTYTISTDGATCSSPSSLAAEWHHACRKAKMELSVTSHANDVFLYPINPQLPESVQEHLRAESAGPAIYLASVHLKIPSQIKPKELKGGIQRIEVTLNSRETLSVSLSAGKASKGETEDGH